MPKVGSQIMTWLESCSRGISSSAAGQASLDTTDEFCLEGGGSSWFWGSSSMPDKDCGGVMWQDKSSPPDDP